MGVDQKCLENEAPKLQLAPTFNVMCMAHLPQAEASHHDHSP